MRRRTTYTWVAAVAMLAAGVARSGSPDAGATDASAVRFEAEPAPEFATTCRMRTDSVDVIVEGRRVIFSIDSARGRGTAAITRKGERWPDEIVVRLNVSSLEQLKLSLGGETVDDPPARAFDADGKATDGSPGPGGHFDVTVPRALTVGTEDKTLVVTWADVIFRR